MARNPATPLPSYAELEREVERCHKRLEIDHYFVDAGDGKGLVSVPVPYEERKHFPDGVSCRDETIKLQDEAIDKLRAQRSETPAPDGRLSVQIDNEVIAELAALLDERKAENYVSVEAVRAAMERRIQGSSASSAIERSEVLDQEFLAWMAVHAPATLGSWKNTWRANVDQDDAANARWKQETRT